MIGKSNLTWLFFKDYIHHIRIKDQTDDSRCAIRWRSAQVIVWCSVCVCVCVWGGGGGGGGAYPGFNLPTPAHFFSSQPPPHFSLLFFSGTPAQNSDLVCNWSSPTNKKARPSPHTHDTMHNVDYKFKYHISISLRKKHRNLIQYDEPYLNFCQAIISNYQSTHIIYIWLMITQFSEILTSLVNRNASSYNWGLHWHV